MYVRYFYILFYLPQTHTIHYKYSNKMRTKFQATGKLRNRIYEYRKTVNSLTNTGSHPLFVIFHHSSEA